MKIVTPTRYNLRSNPDKEANTTLWSWYQSVIGSLLYIMLGTWPDITYSIIKMLQFSANPTKEHLQKALYIVCYFSSTTDLCICYSGFGDKNGFIAYSDTDWGGDIETSWSTTGYAMFLANGIISWLSWWQKRVHLSSTEAGYVLRIAYKRDLILNYLTQAMLTRRPTSVKHSLSQELRLELRLRCQGKTRPRTREWDLNIH